MMTRATDRASPLQGVSVLVVEDEFYLAMDIKEEIERAQGTVFGPAPDSTATMSLIAEQRPDCAVVDINLGEGASFEVATELHRRRIPFLFLTGYEADLIPSDLAHIPRIEKPAEVSRVIEAITRLSGH
ncbi:MAG: response regulator [Sphingomicrobium sp.]